ncbi:hypothetical protein FH972_002244 [Carpinus fangiana]|uniref:Uncharacterized protein n=1 Tax=Carpinus fangiana TaxID=176857 RepID=A0A5N6QE92_9ROSI|nr:hypothetical protein FH972_002244 [Carpinus fangiana]
MSSMAPPHHLFHHLFSEWTAFHMSPSFVKVIKSCAILITIVHLNTSTLSLKKQSQTEVLLPKLWLCLRQSDQRLGLLQSLVPLGSVEELLAAYDSQRRELPPPVTVWEWGWTKSAETWNGRAAMLAVLVLLVLEVTTGEGFLHQWGILPSFR